MQDQVKISEEQFEVLAKILRSTGFPKDAARLVLMEGKRVSDAVSATGLLQPAVSRTVRRYKQLYQLIKKAF